MASLCKKGRMWYVRLRDETGRERSIKAGPDKSVANQMKRDLESKVQASRPGFSIPGRPTLSTRSGFRSLNM